MFFLKSSGATRIHGIQNAQNTVRRIRILAGLAAAAVLLSGCGGRKIVFTADAAGDVVFTVGSARATSAELRVYYTNLQREYEETFGSDIWSHEGNETLGAAVKDNALARLAKVKVLNLMAQDEDLQPDGQTETLAGEAAESYYRSLNETEKHYLDADEQLLQKMYEEYALAQQEYQTIIRRADIEVSDDEARTVTCQQILIRGADDEARSKAESIRQEIRDGIANLTGKTFESYVAEYNEGDEGEITVTRDEEDEALVEAAFALGVGEISEPVQTEEGWRILKCIRSGDEQEIQENKARIMKERQEAAFASAYDTYIGTLDYRLDQDEYDAITLVTDPEITTNTFFTVYEAFFPA